ncbi:MAG: hypothetical protein ACYDBJ_13770 [Aggregatilineales bacterium]
MSAGWLLRLACAPGSIKASVRRSAAGANPGLDLSTARRIAHGTSTPDPSADAKRNAPDSDQKRRSFRSPSSAKFSTITQPGSPRRLKL